MTLEKNMLDKDDLFKEACNGLYDLGLMETLINDGLDVNYKKAGCNNLLAILLSEPQHKGKLSKIPLVKLLLAAGADSNSENYEGDSVLSLALPNEEISEMLIDSGADVNFIDRYKDSLLHYALKKRSSPDVIDALLRKGADCNYVNPDTDRSIFETLMVSNYYENQNLLLNVLSLFTQHGLNISRPQDMDCIPPKTLSCSFVKAVVNLGFDIGYKRNGSEWSMLHYACKFKKPEVIKLLIDSGIDVNEQNEENAVFENSLFSILISNGCDNPQPYIDLIEAGVVDSCLKNKYEHLILALRRSNLMTAADALLSYSNSLSAVNSGASYLAKKRNNYQGSGHLQVFSLLGVTSILNLDI